MDPAAFLAVDPNALGDRRRAARLERLVAALAAAPEASPPAACGSWAATKAAYRFWDSAHVTPAAIRAAHAATTRARAGAEGVVLAIQDTTDLDVSGHPATTGVGPLAHPARRGLLVHSVLAATPAGVPLGLLHQQVWARDAAIPGTRRTRRRRATADKESQRWRDALAAAQAAAPAPPRVVTVADRAADIFDLFARPRPPHSDLLIRAAHNRRVDVAPPDPAPPGAAAAADLWPTVRAAAPLGLLAAAIPRADGRPARDATLTVRAAALALRPPRHHRERAALAPVPVAAVLAAEEAPPAGVAPIRWLLVTTLPVADLADAVRCVDWYKRRWLIERYHFVLKSGCRVERLQLQTADRLERALATYAVVAARVLWLTHRARADPDAACTVVLARHEWEALSCAVHRVPTPPAAPPSLRQAVRWIAQLGGFLGRTRDGEPGAQTVWRGLRRLADLAAMYRLLHPRLPPPESSDPVLGNA